MATDPVCGMSVEESGPSLRLVRDNRTYYFCCGDCLRTFAAPEEARRRLFRRLAVAWPLSIAIVALVWGVTAPWARFVEAGLAAVVQAYPGAGFYAGARDALRRRIGNMDLLIATGTTAAFAYSVAVLALPGRLPSATYFDASALIVTVILTGNYLESLTRRRAGSALRHLGELLPRTAEVVDGVASRAVPVAELRPGLTVRVAPGERFPVDGVVRGGASSVDEAILTGEPAAVRKVAGDRVLAGSWNLEGPLTVEATATGPDTFVAQVGELLQDAELARVPLQQRADRLASRFVPFVLVLAVVAGAAWSFVARGQPTVGVLVFVTVAVTACPCAFGLATPAALLVGTGRAAEEGILFRGGDSIERAATIDTVLFDKTGTLTEVEPEVDGVLAVAPTGEAEVVAFAAGLEAGIRHPLARALDREARRRGLTPTPMEEVRLDPGRGVVGRSSGHAYGVLRAESDGLESVRTGAIARWADEVEQRGGSWSAVVRDGRPLGAIAFRAPIASDAAPAVRALRSAGMSVAIVTGDREAAATAVARSLGVAEVHAGVSPAEKVAVVRSLQRKGRRVAFVGDGVNDAPALAAADLGVAVGGGTEVAREAGQVLLVRPGLSGVPAALSIARSIVRRVRANLLWAVGYNAVLLPIAAGALVPVFGLAVYRALPVLGAVAMGLSSTTVLASSLSLRRTIPRGTVAAGLGRAGAVAPAEAV
jgi:P-type Cu+ transporter